MRYKMSPEVKAAEEKARQLHNAAVDAMLEAGDLSLQTEPTYTAEEVLKSVRNIISRKARKAA